MDNLVKRTISISPVTRIEGHAKISIQLDENGQVSDALFHVNEFRGFEKFCEGRMYTEMPIITPRICGICPVSHSIASVKACEMIQGIQPAYTGNLIRRLIHIGQNISSHALSFFHLSSPDFLLGYDCDPAKRNILGLAEQYPEIALRGIRLRKFGQEISERITGKKVHSGGIAPGGMAFPLTEEARKALIKWIPEAIETVQLGLNILKKFHDENFKFVQTFAASPTLYLGTVGPDGEAELYDGKLRFMDADGTILHDQADPKTYLDLIAERSVDWSYLKYPYYKPYGFEKGFYRVGPLARLNVASKMKTPLAQREFEDFKALGNGKPVHGTFYYHYARLIEALSSVEEAEWLLNNPEITSGNIQTHGQWNFPEGIGCSEAPRGTLFHHYITDETGKLLKVNLLIATGQNNPAMNRSITDVARQYVDGNNMKESMLNRVESAIRCYDPCLSCSTHAMGSMPMAIELKNADGMIIKVLERI
ncbi:Ni/Fe hydrogenase subunit alpha [Chitinophagaceae bacterium LB-8]|uniref:Ni/Fe hydrogenase subunit alpha n=1 Tax=Paraflavisolibacter caeni TaxID=2982496 RepID=A0A9X2XV60_9BACT|nr:Ni/Fe hydrogenase subunit alpha [Paraflavisolibacter caeni]MCU7549136.1 Ni/Fe hydrogenase subunit alpha [Paraflavisolibacter caeni]